MQRGKSQQTGGSLFADLPVIRRQTDWFKIDPASSKAIVQEPQKKYPNQDKKETKRRRTK